MDELAAGTVVSYSYDAGSKPGHARTAVFRNYVDSNGGRAMYCDDGTLNGQSKLFLLKYVRNLLIEDDPTGMCSTSEAWWRLHDAIAALEAHSL